MVKYRLAMYRPAGTAAELRTTRTHNNALWAAL